MSGESKPIERTRSGKYKLRLSDTERSVLKGLPAELRSQIAEGRDDGSIIRLFPTAYRDDLGRQIDYDQLMRDDLQVSHLEALQTLEDTAEATELTEEELDDWLRALNQLRLVMGTRLGITEETTDEDFVNDEQRAGGFALYEYLGHLQTAGIEAMSDVY